MRHGLFQCLLEFARRIRRPVFALELLCLNLAVSFPVPAWAGFLHANGTKILDGAGQPVLLRGVNLGTWLYFEMGDTGWTPFPGADDYEKLKAIVNHLMEGDTNLTARVFDALWSNYVQPEDISFLRSLNLNSVRVPLQYQLFYDPATRQDLDTGFVYLDRLISWCSTNGIYVIPDLHGVPGGKDYSVAGNVFTSTANRAVYLRVWSRIAAQYATNEWIGGYDVLNEPFNGYGGASIPAGVLSRLYAEAVAAIRLVDTNHMVICEGDRWAIDLSSIQTTGWTDSNLCYSTHYYAEPLPLGTSRKRICVGANVPLWVGEFGCNSTHWINRIIDGFEQPHLLTANGQTATIQASWALWSFKCSSYFYLVENPQTPGWSALKAYWSAPSTFPKPSVKDAYRWFLEYAEASRFTNCLVHREVLDALTRPWTSFSTTNLAYNPTATIPGRIMATDFDMGAQNIAYRDTIYDDEAARGPFGVIWNSGYSGRDEGVDISEITDPGAPFKVGWNDAGEWQRHTVTSTPGNYNLHIRYGAGSSTGQMQVSVNGVNVSGTVNLPSSGAWDVYLTRLISNVAVTASGRATVEIRCLNGGYDLLWIEFVPREAPPPRSTGLTGFSGNGVAALKWLGVEGATGYLLKRANVPGGPYIALGSCATPGLLDTGLTNGITGYYVLAATNQYGTGPESVEAAVAPQANALPSGWLEQDIWSSTWWCLGLPGGTCQTNGAYDVIGSGSDIWGTSDGFHYVYRGVVGDCTLVARVTAVQNTDPWAKAGLMIRETLHENSPNVFMTLTSANGALFSYRLAAGQPSSSNSRSGVSAPQWLKLVRRGNTFTGYVSTDGAGWIQVGSVVVPMSSPVFVGLAVTAHNRTLLNHASFDKVAVAAQAPPPANLRASWSDGLVTLSWCASAGAVTYTVKRSTTEQGPYAVIARGVTGTTFRDLTATNGAPCFYIVTAVNANGESAPSAVLAVGPALRLLVLESETVLTWSAAADSYTLYFSTNLSAPLLWQRSIIVPLLTNGVYVVPLRDLTNQATFYLLQSE